MLAGGSAMLEYNALKLQEFAANKPQTFCMIIILSKKKHYEMRKQQVQVSAVGIKCCCD